MTYGTCCIAEEASPVPLGKHCGATAVCASTMLEGAVWHINCSDMSCPVQRMCTATHVAAPATNNFLLTVTYWRPAGGTLAASLRHAKRLTTCLPGVTDAGRCVALHAEDRCWRRPAVIRRLTRRPGTTAVHSERRNTGPTCSSCDGRAAQIRQHDDTEVAQLYAANAR